MKLKLNQNLTINGKNNLKGAIIEVEEKDAKSILTRNWPTSFPELYFVQDNKGNSYLVGQTIYKQTKSGKQVIRRTNSRNERQAETVIYFYLKKRTKHNKLINFYHAWHQSKDILKIYIKQELAKTER